MSQTASSSEPKFALKYPSGQHCARVTFRTIERLAIDGEVRPYFNKSGRLIGAVFISSRLASRFRTSCHETVRRERVATVDGSSQTFMHRAIDQSTRGDARHFQGWDKSHDELIVKHPDAARRPKPIRPTVLQSDIVILQMDIADGPFCVWPQERHMIRRDWRYDPAKEKKKDRR